MWHMICAKGTQIIFRDIIATDTEGSSHWECHYNFLKDEHSGHRSVHKIPNTPEIWRRCGTTWPSWRIRILSRPSHVPVTARNGLRTTEPL